VWILLFTCAVIRAVHLEVVTELSANHVLLAMRRFVARRGKPKLIISDNARGFQLAKKVLIAPWNQIMNDPTIHHYFAKSEIEWKFIIEYAPWMGGFYERMVGTVKKALRKTVGKSHLDHH
jgi:transposase InsO family protein